MTEYVQGMPGVSMPNPLRPRTGELLRDYYARVDINHISQHYHDDHVAIVEYLRVWHDTYGFNPWGELPHTPPSAPKVPSVDAKISKVTPRWAFWFYRDQLDEILGPPERWAENVMKRIAA